VMGIPSTPTVGIYDVTNKDSLRGLVFITDTLTVLPVPGQVGRTMQVSNDKYPAHQPMGSTSSSSLYKTAISKSCPTIVLKRIK